MILKFDKKEFTKSWNKWGLGAWCQTWIRMGLLDPKGLVTIVIILSLVAGIFYWKGIKNTPVEIGKDLFNYEQEFTLRLNPKELAKNEDPALRKPKNSSLLHYADWRTGVLGKPIKVEDIKELRKKLKPYGFMSHLLFVEGVGSGIDNIGLEAGLAIRYAKLWQIRSEVIGTNRGGYLGFSYKPSWKYLPNSSIGLGGGKGYKGEDRGLLYFSVEL